MERFALEYNKDGEWIKLNHYTNLSKHKAQFLQHICQTTDNKKQIRMYRYDWWVEIHTRASRRETLCIGALMFFEVNIDKDVYTFCHEYVESGLCKDLVDEYHEKGQTYLWTQIKDAYDTWKHEKS